SQVSGNPDIEFHAKFAAAESSYLQLVEAGNAEAAEKAKGKKPVAASTSNREDFRTAAITNLENTIKLAPAAERGASGPMRTNIRDIKGRAIYMLVALTQKDPKADQARIADLLNNYEGQYPNMKERFQDIAEWRIKALDT